MSRLVEGQREGKKRGEGKKREGATFFRLTLNRLKVPLPRPGEGQWRWLFLGWRGSVAKESSEWRCRGLWLLAHDGARGGGLLNFQRRRDDLALGQLAPHMGTPTSLPTS